MPPKRPPAPSCRSCRFFLLADALLEPKHRALDLGHCDFDARRYAFKTLTASCLRYVPTPARAAWLAHHFPAKESA